jgi:hypothetical protein
VLGSIIIPEQRVKLSSKQGFHMDFLQKNKAEIQLGFQGINLSDKVKGFSVGALQENVNNKFSLKPQEILKDLQILGTNAFRTKYGVHFNVDFKQALARAYGLLRVRDIHKKLLGPEQIFKTLSTLGFKDTSVYGEIFYLFQSGSCPFKLYQKLCELTGVIVPTFDVQKDSIFLDEANAVALYGFETTFQSALGLGFIKEKLMQDFEIGKYDERFVVRLLDRLYHTHSDFQDWYNLGFSEAVVSKTFFETSSLSYPFMKAIDKILSNENNLYLRVSENTSSNFHLDVITYPKFSLHAPLTLNFQNDAYKPSIGQVFEVSREDAYCFRELNTERDGVSLHSGENEILYQVWDQYKNFQLEFGPIGVFAKP